MGRPLIVAGLVPSREHILESIRREVEGGYSIGIDNQIALFLLLHQ